MKRWPSCIGRAAARPTMPCNTRISAQVSSALSLTANGSDPHFTSWGGGSFLRRTDAVDMALKAFAEQHGYKPMPRGRVR